LGNLLGLSKRFASAWKSKKDVDGHVRVQILARHVEMKAKRNMSQDRREMGNALWKNPQGAKRAGTKVCQ